MEEEALLESEFDGFTKQEFVFCNGDKLKKLLDDFTDLMPFAKRTQW